MANLVFTAALAALLSGVLVFSFKMLPKEKWQILAAVPVAKDSHGNWEGLNLTWYGLLNANAYTVGVAMVMVLMGAVHVAPEAVLALVVTVLAICVPASRIVARLVEKKPYTFTVGGATFVGMVIIPWLIVSINAAAGESRSFYIHLLPALSALAIAYALGEGLGRLACISFGCCYGKRLSEYPAPVQRLFHRFAFTFKGATKKIAYASDLEGEPVLPVQAITSVLYLATCLVSIWLFLSSCFLPAYVLCLVVTQGWRAISEVFRADYRGGGKVSAYQIMSVAGACYCLVIAVVFQSFQELFPYTAPPVPPVNIAAGLKSLWTPGIILFLQAIWLTMFLFTGRSMVTGSTLSFYVHRHRV